MKRKMFSILLALCMVVSLLPVTALAADTKIQELDLTNIVKRTDDDKVILKNLPVGDYALLVDSSGYYTMDTVDSQVAQYFAMFSAYTIGEDVVDLTNGASMGLDYYGDLGQLVDESGCIFFTVEEANTEYEVFDIAEKRNGCVFIVYKIDKNNSYEDIAHGKKYYAVTHIGVAGEGTLVPLPDYFVDAGNGMAYYCIPNDVAFEIYGKYLNSWKDTSWSSYSSYLVEDAYEDENDAEAFAYSDATSLISATTSLKGKIEIKPVEGQQLLEIAYTVENTSDSVKSYAIGSSVDIKIGENDAAVITPFTDKAGFKMLEGGKHGAQFNFFGNDVTSFWYGPYDITFYYLYDGDRVRYNLNDYLEENISGWTGYYSSSKDAIFKSQKDDSINADSVKEIIKDHLGITVDEVYLDSTASWRWNGTLAADESVTHSVYIGIGQPGSDKDVDIPGSDDDTPTPPTATDTDTPAPTPPVYYPSVDPTPVIPSVDVDIHNDSLSAAAKAVGSAVKSGKADIIPAEGYTKESIAKMQNSGELNLVIEKNAGYDEAEKKLLDDAIIAKGGAAGSVMYLEIDALLMSDDGKVVAEVDDTIVPLTITVDLNAEMQKAAKEGKTIYVARAHDGKVAFIEGTLNADKTKLTFDSSKFSTYALVAFDGETITSAQTADPIGLYFGVTALATVGSAWLSKKKED